MVTVSEWRILLADWNENLLADEQIKANLPAEVLQSGWLGFEPASEKQILLAEQRLGRNLPYSYRTFLKVTNGWRMTGHFVDRVRPVEEIDLFRIENRNWVQTMIEAYKELEPISDEEYFVYGEEQSSPRYRPEYLLSAIQVSDVGDSAVYLLNPQVQQDDREWEAWFFATWNLGAERYRSFWEMMRAEYQAYKELRSSDMPVIPE